MRADEYHFHGRAVVVYHHVGDLGVCVERRLVQKRILARLLGRRASAGRWLPPEGNAG
jgi:hypothetical protein